MNEKYSLKIIQHGKTQQVRIVQEGAGITGQAVVVQAKDAARFQIVNVVTLASPTKLQLKRVGDALHLVLPGGDIDAPDLVIQDYFKVKGASLQGASISGEWMSYDTANLVDQPSAATSEAADVAQTAVDKTSTVTLGGSGALGTFAEHPWLWAGGLAAAAAAGGGGGGGGSSTQSPTLQGLELLRAYSAASNGAGVTVPTLASYKEAGIKALANLSETTASADIDSASVTGALGVSSAAWLITLNSALDKRTDGNTLTAAQVQAMVASYYRILSEADGVVNTTTNTDVYTSVSDATGGATLAGNNDPSATDYTNIGATVGGTLKSLDLLNDFVGLSADAAVDTVVEIDAAARAAENVMLKAKGATATATGGPAIYTTDAEWVSGLTALGVSGVTISNIAAVKQAIDSSTDNTTGDGSAVDTVAEIQALVSLAKLTAYTDDLGVFSGTPAKSAATPTLADWNAIGVKARANLSDASATQDLTASNANLNALNSALDRWGSATNLAGVPTAKATLQGVVDAYARVLGEADGNRATDVNVYSTGSDANDPAQTDYEKILGGSSNLTTLTTGADAKWLALLNDSIGGLSTSAVDTADEVEDLIKASVNVMKQAVGTGWSYTTDADWVSALSSLGVSGLSGMSSTNLATVKADIANISSSTDIDTWAELQSIVSLVRIKDYANLNTNAVPNFSDYQAFFTYGTSGKTDIANSTTYVNAFNDAVNYKPSNAFTSAEVKSLVDGYAAILAEANGSSAGDQQTYDPNASDYLAVGVGLGLGNNDQNVLNIFNHASDVNAASNTVELVNLMTDVVANKTQAEVDSINELNNLAKIITKIYELETYSGAATNGGATGVASSAYTGIYGGALQVSELKAAGLDVTNLENTTFSTAVLTKRLYDVYDHITAVDHTSQASRTTLDSLQELQQLITNTSVITA